MEAFREIDIFRTPPPMSFPYICSDVDSIKSPLPRMNRVCTKCLSSFTPWVKYDFVCRRFKCETRLVPSDIAERKRYCLLASSRSPILRLLPEDGIAAVVDFLGGDELCNLFSTSSNMCIIAERVARTRVEEAADQFPSGPLCVSSRKCFLRENENNPHDAPTLSDPRTEIRSWIYATNEHDFGLRAPDDANTWTGIYHYMEKMTAENYYFDFQTQIDGGAVCRFIAQPLEEKFGFSETFYSTQRGQNLVVANHIPRGITIKGGQVGIFDESRMILSNHTFVSNQVLILTGEDKQRFIGRLFCPGAGSLSPPTRDILGAVGFVRIHRNRMAGNNDEEERPDAKWLTKVNLLEGWLKDDSVFGFEYDPSNRSLNVRTFGFSRLNRSQSSHITIAAEDASSDDDIVLAFELSPKAAKENALLSVRKCESDDVWIRFLEHLPDETPAPQAAAEEETAAEALFLMEDADENRGRGLMGRRIRRRMDHMDAARRRRGFDGGHRRVVARNVGAQADVNMHAAGNDNVEVVNLEVEEGAQNML